MASSPHLPPELEYQIFLLTFQVDHKEAKTLILIAKRVFDWLIPHIFNVVRLNYAQPLPTKFNEPVYQRYGKHTRHLFIQPGFGSQYLHLFPNVIDLAFWANCNQDHIQIFLQLPLTRISIDLSPALFQIFSNSKLTHLDCLTNFYSIDEESVASVLHPLVYLPNLTHLCVVPSTSADILELFLDKGRCPQLKVLIIWGSSVNDFAELNSNTWSEYEGSDPRVLHVKCDPEQNWEVGARGGVDMWEFADGVLNFSIEE
ncbi:hypothetical protein BDN72DRAFT_900110 [Pluteus cervinus]|uniref:Uncharacterized protein n=1 Tax=Pluteus cervinus TaxID=181527 RepID=A0ACD3AJR9_9AGAR|nr:hypothetical protein BDN72DRAFT_900110 [Pluteus cervinus]